MSEFPSGWTVTTLGEAFKWGSGGTPSRGRPDFYGGDIPWAMIGDLDDGLINSTAERITEAGLESSSAKIVPAGSVLLAMYGSIGKLGLNTTSMATNQAIAFTTPAVCSARFLFYFLLRSRNDLQRLGKGGTQSNISQTVIREIPFAYPSSAEQDALVAKLDTYLSRLDAATATLERAQRNLKRYRASVLKAALEGRLVPTEAALARAEGRSYEPASVLLERILAERRARWEASGKKGKYKEPVAPDTKGLPELPEGWCWGTVEQVTDFVTDGDHQPPPQVPTGVPFLVIGNVNSGIISFQDCRFVPESYFAALSYQKKPMPGDLLFTVTGSLGIVVPVVSNQEFCVQRHIAIMRPSLGLAVGYLGLALRSDHVFAQASRIATGTAQKTVPLTGLRQILVPLPPLEEQARISAEASRLLSVADATRAGIRADLARLTGLRSSILRAAFRGELV